MATSQNESVCLKYNLFKTLYGVFPVLIRLSGSIETIQYIESGPAML